MSITQVDFCDYLDNLCHDMQKMFKSQYQYTDISSNHFLSEIDIMIYYRVGSTLQVVYNTYLSDNADKWTQIYEHLVGIQDTCRLRLVDLYWFKFEACLRYARANIQKTVPQLLAEFRTHV